MKRVLLVNWDCYPNLAVGGVYTWTKSLIEKMIDYEYIVVNQLSNPNIYKDYVIPKNVTRTIEIPLFGCNRYEEFYDEKKSLISKILRTTESVIEKDFLPLYKDFISSVISDKFDPKHFIDIVLKLHEFLIKHDSKKCFEHYLTWEAFLGEINKDPLYKNMTIMEASTAFQILQRNMDILALEVPKVDIVHCSLAWTASLIAIFAKMESKCPVIITEHGVAYKELLLFFNAYMNDGPARIFFKIFSKNLIKAIYSIADVITPVCNANAYWARYLGAEESKIKVVYNGVDNKRFKPMEVERENDRPTIVTMARVDVFKDFVCLINSINLIKEKIPDILCLIYGTSIDLEYSLRCVKMVKDLDLEDNVKFLGGTKEPEKAYNLGDIVVITSIMEGFPFTIIEGMACGKALVASNVGGIGEALEGCGLLVRSRRPNDLASAIIKLLQDKKLRNEFELAAVKQVENKFTLKHTVDTFRKLYGDLINLYKENDYSGPPIKEAILP